jgi:hypothetical protein
MRLIFLSLLVTLCAQVSASSITSITSAPGSSTVEVMTDEQIVFTPAIFSTGRKIAVDLIDIDNPLGRQVAVANNSISQVNVATSNGRTRIVVTVPRNASGNVSVAGKIITIEIHYDPELTVTFTKTPVELFAEATAAVDKKDNTLAIELLNSLLLMPEHKFSQRAQLMIAEAYEQVGKLEHAKNEYRSYITAYPSATDFKSVQQRLIALEISTPARGTPAFAATERLPFQGKDYKSSASISEYYYTTASGPSFNGTHREDESLLTNARMTGTYKSDELQTKINIRYSQSDNLIDSTRNKQNLSVAWVDVQNTFKDYGLRVGRQSTGYGTLGRFDGAFANYTVDNTYRLVFVTGVPYLAGSNTQRSFYSIGADINTNEFSNSVYYNEGTADGIPERQAIGAEIRYYKNNQSVTLITEYDILYKALNSFMMQGNFSFEKTSPYVLIDRRKSPVLYAERAIYLGLGAVGNQPFLSVGDTFANSGVSADAIYRYISDSTPMASTFVIGTSTRLTDNWVLGTDMQITNTAPVDLAAIPNLDLPVPLLKQDGSGNSRTYNAILYGTDIYTKSNMITHIVSITTDDLSKLYSLTSVDSFAYGTSRIEVLGKYFMRTQPGITMSSIMTSLRLNAKLSERSSLDTALSISRSVIRETSTETFTHSFYIGYRVDF